MRTARWQRYLLLTVLSFSAAGAAAAGEAGGVPAFLLASPDDLVVLDAAPATEVLEPLIPEEVIQSAFPVFYGTLPVTTAPEAPAAATTPPEAAPSVAALPPPPAAPVNDSVLNQPVPEPLPPPAELLQGAGALPAARNTADPVPSISPDSAAARALDGTPLPPPLPELPAGAATEVPPTTAAATLPATPTTPTTPAEPDAMPGAPAGDVYSPPAPPRTLEEVRIEFAALKTYCESDSLGSAAEIYARMPDFGDDEEMNRLRADAANLLILGLARSGNLMAARRIYDSVPTEMPGFDARLAKARAVINLATYCIRAQQFNDAFAVLMDAGKIQNRSALNNELFRLMARMIPYLDNAEETDKARRIFDLLLSEVKSPGTAALFAENVRASVLTYYFHYVDNSDSPVHRRKRLDFLEHIFISLDSLARNDDVLALKRTLGNGLAERYAGDPNRASQFRVDSF